MQPGPATSSGASGLFAFELKGGGEAERATFIDSLALFGIGYSWGGYESLALPVDPANLRTATHWGERGPLVRINVGPRILSTSSPIWIRRWAIGATPFRGEALARSWHLSQEILLAAAVITATSRRISMLQRRPNFSHFPPSWKVARPISGAILGNSLRCKAATELRIATIQQ